MMRYLDDTEETLKAQVIKFSNLASNPAACVLHNYAKPWKYFQTSIGSNYASSKNYNIMNRRILGKINCSLGSQSGSCTLPDHE
jgi:hypothetical protein